MKTTRILSGLCAAILSATFVLALAPAARATPLPNLVYNVTLSLTSLGLDPSGPFSLDFQLNPGSGNVSNTVTLSNFVFTGGTADGTPNFTFGTESGSLTGSLILSNAGSGSEFTEGFSAGVTQITFQVSQTPNSEVVGSGTAIPDEFSVDIQDGSFATVATTDPTGANTLISSAISESETVGDVNVYTLDVIAAPEPSTYAMMLAGLITLVVALRRRSRVA